MSDRRLRNGGGGRWYPPLYHTHAILNVGDLNQTPFGLQGPRYSWAGNNVDPGDCP
ncbi:MAG: hypothetical protein JSU63_14370 [Phycisphaerales bacterium]|nr:MAG: hypothetical protein JSU63_14370 [Phycisphaerales bacterium]